MPGIKIRDRELTAEERAWLWCARSWTHVKIARYNTAFETVRSVLVGGAVIRYDQLVRLIVEANPEPLAPGSVRHVIQYLTKARWLKMTARADVVHAGWPRLADRRYAIGDWPARDAGLHRRHPTNEQLAEAMDRARRP